MEHSQNSLCVFVHGNLTKDDKQRPKYIKLLEHPFIKMYEEREVSVADYVCKVLDQYKDTTGLEHTVS
ncbi:hypothetical protein ScPMuIL_004338 [Solemya velum]